MTKSLALGLLLAILIGGGVARADSQSSANSTRMWRAQDACAKKAFKQFPDYTPEGNAKRERARRLCLATGNLPPRNEAPLRASQPDDAPAH